MRTSSLPFRSERLRVDHDLADFACGNPTLDDWFRETARHADRAGVARLYVWTDVESAVVAYYALAPHLVHRQRVPKRVGGGSTNEIPSILLARLALAEHLHGRGLGAELLSDAVRTSLRGISVVGGRLIVVDAIDDRAASFYVRFGFVASDQDAQRLMLKASDAAKALGEPWG